MLSHYRLPWRQRSQTTTRWHCHWEAVTLPRPPKWGISAAATSSSFPHSLPPCRPPSLLPPPCSSPLWAPGGATSIATFLWHCWMDRWEKRQHHLLLLLFFYSSWIVCSIQHGSFSWIDLLLFMCMHSEFYHIKNKTPLFSPGVQSRSLGNKRSVWIKKENVERKYYLYMIQPKIYFFILTDWEKAFICSIVMCIVSYMRHGAPLACNSTVILFSLF